MYVKVYVICISHTSWAFIPRNCDVVRYCARTWTRNSKWSRNQENRRKPMASTGLKQLVSSIHETIAARPVLDDLQHLTERTTGGLQIHAGPLKSPNQRICKQSDIIWNRYLGLWDFEAHVMQHIATRCLVFGVCMFNHTTSHNLSEPLACANTAGTWSEGSRMPPWNDRSDRVGPRCCAKK